MLVRDAYPLGQFLGTCPTAQGRHLQLFVWELSLTSNTCSIHTQGSLKVPGNSHPPWEQPSTNDWLEWRIKTSAHMCLWSVLPCQPKAACRIKFQLPSVTICLEIHPLLASSLPGLNVPLPWHAVALQSLGPSQEGSSWAQWNGCIYLYTIWATERCKENSIIRNVEIAFCYPQSAKGRKW